MTLPINKDNDRSNKHAWLYLIGIVAVFVSLSVTLASITYNKPLTGMAQHVVTDALAVAILPLIVSALDRLMPEVHSAFQKATLIGISLALFIWFIIWAYSYVPGGFLT
jgi:hypothetical protein